MLSSALLTSVEIKTDLTGVSTDELLAELKRRTEE